MLEAKRREAAGGGEAGKGKDDDDGDDAKEATTTTKATTTSTSTTTTLRSLIESGDAAKGRLLYYYPPGQRNTSFCGEEGEGEEEKAAVAAASASAAPSENENENEEEVEEEEEEEVEEQEDNWCGWHVDSGALTALVRAMFLDAEGREVEPDPGSGAGLYIRPRRGWKGSDLRRRSSSAAGETGPEAFNNEEKEDDSEEAPAVRVSIPEGCVAVQAGEAAQVFSGGAIVAAPHCVRGIKKSKSNKENNAISRSTFALFMQPRWDAPLEPSVAPVRLSLESVGVARWRPGDTFGDFTERTFDAYYK